MTRTIFALLLLALPCGAIDIPSLNWQQRSDWINVRTNIPAAVGNGVADDTAALQAALNATNSGKTIFLPVGTYKITSTLKMSGNTAVTIIGAGRDTQIVWAGTNGGVMFWSDGNPYTRYIGLSWNGSGSAAVGFDHASTSLFETEIQHINEAYRNFTGYGIRVGNSGSQASAEILYRNCLFVNCTNGLAFLAFNDYDNTIDHCEFQSCSNAILASHGNFYARNSHFQNSTYDFNFANGSEHGSSIRRCTSTGSKYFANDGSIVSGTTIQDCQVANWTATDKAIHLSSAPVLMFDTVFTNGPVGSFPIESSFGAQKILISSNTPTSTASLITGIPANRTYQITNGTKTATLTNASQTFLIQTSAVPSIVFDAKVNFGAVGNGVANDTTAIQNTINAARNYGHGAMAYIPVGSYFISSTLLVSGSNYFVGGSGRKSCLHWHGTAGLPFMVVTNVQNVSISDMGIGTPDCSVGNNGDDILVTGPSICTVNLDGLHVYGPYALSPDTHGLKLDSLPTNSIVTVPMFRGNIRITNCQQATLIFRTTYDGIVTLRGPASTNSVASFLTRLTTASNPALQVFDNQSVTMSDFYLESAQQIGTFNGAVGQSGAITIQHPKVGLISPYTNIFAIDGYNGRIFIGEAQYSGLPTNTWFSSINTASLQLTFAGSTWYNSTNSFNLDGNTSLSLLGNLGVGSGGAQFDSGTNATTMLDIGGALDDLRTLGRVELSTPDVVPIWSPHTNIAASCSQSDVQAAINLSYPGDTVFVPGGTCAWTTTVTCTNAITIVFQGTVIPDSIANTGDGAASSCLALNISNVPDLPMTVTGVIFQPGTRATQLFESGNIHVTGNSSKVRLYNNVFNASKNIGVGWYDCFGVFDHNTWTNHQFVQLMKVHHGNYGTSGGYGDGAWALPPWTNSNWEDASALYIEDNVLTNLSGVTGLGIDGDSGARFVFRHNTNVDRLIVGGHGMETTGRARGSRLKDIYANTFIGHGDSEAGHWRSSGGIWASNILINYAGTAGFTVRNYRMAFGGFWKYANGTNVWDVNDLTIYGAGTATAGGTLALTDSTANWTPHAFIARSVRNVNTGRSSIVIDNTATSLTFIASTDSPGSDLSFSPGDTYQIRRIITVMDEVGRGQGLLVSNATPVIAGIAQNPQQVVEPVWQWSNTLNGGTPVMNNGGYYSSVVGQEIRNEFNPNWRAFQYPHPLVTGTNAPTPPPPVITITSQPASTNIYVTQSALFTITATGTAPITYQWRTNNVNAGTNGPALAVGPCPITWNGMSVACVVSNVNGTVTSSTATLTVLPDPVITSQPANATVGVGATASFTVTATGQSALTYQWKKNGSSIGGATLASYTTPATILADNNSQFSVVVTDTAGSVTSATATLTVIGPDPVITSQPQSTNIYATQIALFRVVAAGGSTLSYQWKTNGVNVGTNGPALAVGPAPVAWSGMTIVCVVTDTAGSLTSSTATLTVSPDPSIVTQPQNATTGVGLTASFNVSASGQTTLSYQWKRNGTTISGATLSSYTTPATAGTNNGDSYAVVITDTAGSLTSANATLTVTNVGPDPLITKQPASTNVYSTQAALFSVTASGGSTLTYQWRTNSVNTGTNGPVLALANCAVAWSGMSVLCVVSDLAGSLTSAVATLTVLADPVITNQPANRTIAVGQTATFSVGASGQTSLSYQWSKNGSSIAGATLSAYTTPGTIASDNNSQFFVVVTDTAGSIQSANATLTVTNIPGPDPLIVSQPQSTNIFRSQSALFAITATGNTTLSYQWRTNGVATGTNGPAFSIGPCPTAWSGIAVTCVVTDTAGSVTSSAATLTVSPDPVITTQPASATATVGQTASFNVVATGQSGLTYQWAKNGGQIAGATHSSYVTPPTAITDNGSAFAVTVTDNAGSLQSANATLTVVQPDPIITSQPQSTNIYATQSALFTLSASGNTTLSYQWKTNNVNTGTNGPAFSIGPCPVAWNGIVVLCVVSDVAGSATSSSATLGVGADPVITTQPANKTVGVGNTATFSVVATGQSAITYQWSENGVDIGGATASSYTTPATILADNGSHFAVTVTDTAGTLASANATLTVIGPDPVITSQPQSTNIYTSQIARFAITAAGGTTLSYQWKTNGVVTGTNGPVLILGPCPTIWSGMTVLCIISDVAGTVTSSTATLTVSSDPLITVHPQNASTLTGSTASFSVTATGQSALSYQWVRNGVSILGASHSSYTTPALVIGDNGSTYAADVSDSASTIRSATATLTVQQKPPETNSIMRVTHGHVKLIRIGP